ncbi:MAG: N-methyl-L-tryptophan oxidase [Proteobacteria bacterium]|nr:N-methyl-L-tryptophan oxidase [Pseudomonadota bacterium]
MQTADVIVLGLGAVGSATLYHLAKQGVRAIGIDRHDPPHNLGSSHGESRITRLAVGEGDAYIPLVRRSHDLWRMLEAETRETLMLQTGGLLIGSEVPTPHHGREDFLNRAIGILSRHGIPHEVLASAEIGRRFPQLGLRGDERALYEPSAGVLFPERCIAVQLQRAQALGAVVRRNERVTGVRRIGSGVEVETECGRLQAGRVVMATGPWLPQMVDPSTARLLRVYRQSLHWFPADPVAYGPDRFPVFLWMHGASEEDYFYGFPALGGSGVIKVASERYADATSPETVSRDVPASESAAIFARHVAGRLRGVGGDVTRAAACLYTVTPDSGFLVDRMPDLENVMVVSACSGHGFKHSAALGEAVAASVAGAGDDLIPFALGRFAEQSLPQTK